MQSLLRFSTPAFRFIIRKPDWLAWVFALSSSAVEWNLHHNWGNALEAFAANFIALHLLGRYGYCLAIAFLSNVFGHFYSGTTIHVFNFLGLIGAVGIIAAFVGLFAMAFLVGHLDDRYFKPQVERSGQYSPRALKFALTILGLTGTYVFVICLATGML